MYEKLVETQFPLSVRSARRFTQIAKRIGSKTANLAVLNGWGLEDLLELASAPDDFIDQAVVSDVPPTKEAIKQAKLEARLAKEAEAKAKADAEAMQRELFDLQESSQSSLGKRR